MNEDDKPLVLCVDDEPGVRLVLAGLLRQAGFRCLDAAGAEEALAKIDKQPVEIVITDLQMPNKDGLWLLDQVRKHVPSLPVILLTAHGSVDVAVEAMRRGAFDFLTKPIDRDALNRVLQKALPLSERLFAGSKPLDLIAESPAMQNVLQLVKRMARSDAPVLITGPSGTGKEVVAKALHKLRCGEDKPFVAVNCSAIPESLLESELFGHVKGAFTGATCDKPGRVELATGGTLFLDEIGDVVPSVQVKLLRLVQEKTFERVGGIGTKTADICIAAATHRNLACMVQEGSFREDFFFRLNVLPIVLAPLSERPEDVVPLARAFLSKATAGGTRTCPKIGDDAGAFLEAQPWPGNARELGNLMERIAALCDSTTISVADVEECLNLGATSMTTQRPTSLVVDPEEDKQRILSALESAAGNRSLAAKLLGVSRRTLYNKLERLGIE